MTDAARLPPGQAGGTSPRQAFEFASKHFLLLSAVAVVVGVVASTIFLWGYLSVFDWRLIWVIEYADVLKVGLVALAVISGVWYWVSIVVENAITAYESVKESLRSAARFVGVLFALWVIDLIIFLYPQYTSPEPHYGLVVNLHLSVLFLFVLTFMGIHRVRSGWPKAQATLQEALLLVAFVGIVGTTIGYWTKDSEGSNRDVYMKGGRAIRDVGLIMITSRYVLLYTGDHSVILPLDEVTKIEARPRHTTD